MKSWLKSSDKRFSNLDIFHQQLGGTEKPPHDQPALRAAIYHSNVHFTVLPAEYNLRTNKPLFIGGRNSPKILHGRGVTLKRALKTIKHNDLLAIADFSFKPTIYRTHYRGKTTIYRALIRRTRNKLRPLVQRLRGQHREKKDTTDSR